jgi:RHS repeat-associated protein
VSWPSQRGFVGGTNDPSTGLVHLGAREYDPDIGRFISIDPIIDDTDPQQMHGYAYANNSPVTFSDPDGLKYKCSNPRQCDGSVVKQKADAAKRKKWDAAQKKKREAQAKKTSRPRVDKEDQVYGKRNRADEAARKRKNERVDKEDKVYGKRNREDEAARKRKNERYDKEDVAKGYVKPPKGSKATTRTPKPKSAKPKSTPTPSPRPGADPGQPKAPKYKPWSCGVCDWTEDVWNDPVKHLKGLTSGAVVGMGVGAAAGFGLGCVGAYFTAGASCGAGATLGGQIGFVYGGVKGFINGNDEWFPDIDVGS